MAVIDDFQRRHALLAGSAVVPASGRVWTGCVVVASNGRFLANGAQKKGLDLMQPDRVVDAATGWGKYTLKGDMGAARDLFVGTNCGLCGKSADFDYGQKGLN